jgi:NADPH:quinone reductase-like Zn-dependent oxidoreductase
MKAAVIYNFSQPPRYSDFSDPVPEPGEIVVNAAAAALSPLVKSRSSGRHYSGSNQLPLVSGVDGVGRLPDGRRVYFAFPRHPYGAMAQRVPMQSRYCVALPEDLPDATAAALANPGMSSWAALKERARLAPGEIVLINGATGVAGQLAVQIAKCLGAKKVIATGRNPQALQQLLELGAEVVVSLDQPGEQLLARLRELFLSDGVNIILDYLWGESALCLITAAAGKGSEKGEPRVRFVQIGASSGSEISLPASALRSSGLELLGSGIGSIPMERLLLSIEELMKAAIPAGLKIEAETVPLAEVDNAWNKDSGRKRIVFTIS